MTKERETSEHSQTTLLSPLSKRETLELKERLSSKNKLMNVSHKSLWQSLETPTNMRIEVKPKLLKFYNKSN